MSKHPMSKLDVHQSITDKIVAQIEANPGKWTMPWRTLGINPMPRSADGRYYRGVNIIVLWGAQMDRGYKYPIWATYKQWAKHGCQVQKGEKSEMVVFYKTVYNYNHSTGKDDKTLYARAFFVFNIAQTDGALPGVHQRPEGPVVDERLEAVDDFFANIGAEVRPGGDKAYYSPTHDFIGIPERRQFHTGHDYYSTLGHEHIHWTGHKSRLNRELLSSRFGDEAYAFEELVAELGAAFLCAGLELENEPRDDHAKYLASWLSVLKQDKKAIFTAASKAQSAVDYLTAFQPGGVGEMEEEVESERWRKRWRTHND